MTPTHGGTERSVVAIPTRAAEGMLLHTGD